MVPLKHLNNFWTNLEMPLIYCQINLILTWCENFLAVTITTTNQVQTFALTDTKLYVLVALLSVQDNSVITLTEILF